MQIRFTLFAFGTLSIAAGGTNFAEHCKPPQQQIELRLFDALFGGDTPDDAPSPPILLLRSPEIRVNGQGLNALVTVGSQQIRFDGEEIVFESKN
jgi:hypothetical protein